MAELEVSRVHALERVQPGATLGLARGTAAVCIPLYGQHDLFVQCLHGVLRHTPPDVPILVADDASPDAASEHFLEDLAGSGALRHRLAYARRPENVGFVANVNLAFAALSPA